MRDHRGRAAGARRIGAACAAVALVVAGCSSAPSVSRSPASSSAHSSPPSSAPPSSAPPSSARSSSARSSEGPTATALPRGGQSIIGNYRVVAYYGAAGDPQLGVLGSGSPDSIARAVTARARAFAPYGLPVLPAMELIATVAQGSPQADGSYSRPIPDATIRQYLAVAHRYRMLLILDLQPGRSTFLRQATALHDELLDPSVGLGLDPEWKVGADERPGDGLIGSSGSGDINATLAWVSSLVSTQHLPHKLVVVHEFTSSMLPDRSAIASRPGVDLTFHADGFGSVASKINVFHGLHFPGRPAGVGFKLFLTQDRRLMTPAEVMALSPRPDVITYQ